MLVFSSIELEANNIAWMESCLSYWAPLHSAADLKGSTRSMQQIPPLSAGNVCVSHTLSHRLPTGGAAPWLPALNSSLLVHEIHVSLVFSLWLAMSILNSQFSLGGQPTCNATASCLHCWSWAHSCLSCMKLLALLVPRAAASCRSPSLTHTASPQAFILWELQADLLLQWMFGSCLAGAWQPISCCQSSCVKIGFQ